MSRILIVDDDGETCRFMAELLERPDREIRTTQDAGEALSLAKQPFDLLISDINLDAQQNGMDVLRAFKQANRRRTRRPDQRLWHAGDGDRRRSRRRLRLHQQAVQHFRGQGDRRTRALGCRRTPSHHGRPRRASAGADRTHRRHAVGVQADRTCGQCRRARADHRRQRHRQGARRPRHPRARPAVGPTIRSDQLRRADRKRARVGALRAHARIVHRRDRRYEGHLRAGHGGTVFLDEIGETSRRFRSSCCECCRKARSGRSARSRLVKVDVRVVAATNVDLEREVTAQRFRQDLFYRLSVIVIHVPA